MRVLEEVNVRSPTRPRSSPVRPARQLTLFATRPEFRTPAVRLGGIARRPDRGFRIQLRTDVQRGVDPASFRCPTSTRCAPVCRAVIGACMDMYRGRATLDSYRGILEQLLRLFNVDADKALKQLIDAPQKFVQWRALPLCETDVN